MPLDMSGVHQIIQSYLAGAQVKNQRDELAQRAQMQQELFKQQQEMQKREQAFLAAEHDKQAAILKSQHADANYWAAIKAQANNEIGLQSTTQPIGPSPDTLVPQKLNVLFPGLSGTVTQQMPLAPGIQQATQEVPNAIQHLNLPSGPMDVPAPPSLVEQANRIRTLTSAQAGAEAEAQMPLVQAKANVDLVSHVLQNTLNEERDAKRFKEQEKMLADRIASQEGIADRRMAAMLAGIEMRLKGKQVDPATIERHLPNIANGTYTMDDLPKLGFTGETRLALTNAAEEKGIKLINKDQQKQLFGLGDMQNLFSQYQQLTNIYGNAGLNLKARLTDPKAIALNKTIDATLERVARTFGGTRGVVSNKDADRMRGLRPDPITLPGANQAKLNEVHKLIEGATDNLLTGMDDSQQYSIRKKFGLSTTNFVKGPNGDLMKVSDLQ